MPAKSGKQFRFMQMIAHGGTPSKSNTKSVGPSKKLAEKFIKDTPKEKRSLFSKKK